MRHCAKLVDKAALVYFGLSAIKRRFHRLAVWFRNLV